MKWYILRRYTNVVVRNALAHDIRVGKILIRQVDSLTLDIYSTKGIRRAPFIRSINLSLKGTKERWILLSLK